VSVLQALLVLGVSFGLDITVEQQTSLLAAAGAVAAMLEVARTKSVPANKLTDAELVVVSERRKAPPPLPPAPPPVDEEAAKRMGGLG
jgi:hypothetical protein